MLADLIGTVAKNPEATTPLLMVPQLIFGLLSVGIQPAERFPEWIQPIVRNQPISQFVYALRALAGDTTTRPPSPTLVGDEADLLLVARLACDPGADGIRVLRGGVMALVTEALWLTLLDQTGRVPEHTLGTRRIRLACWFRRRSYRRSDYLSGGAAT